MGVWRLFDRALVKEIVERGYAVVDCGALRILYGYPFQTVVQPLVVVFHRFDVLILDGIGVMAGFQSLVQICFASCF